MEIRRWHYYVLFNCVIIKYLEAKTFSLNDVIAAESEQKEDFETTLPQKSAGTGKRYSLIKRLKSPLRIKNFLESGFFRDRTPLGGNILSPLKYKKTYQIKSPLKPRRLKLIQKSRYKRKNKSAKREINGNVVLKQKYIPLLKSLSMLFDNLLDSDSSESYEVKTKQYRRNRFYSEETFEVPRSTHRSDSGITESESQEETITFSSTLTTAVSIITETPTTTEATSTTANIITTRDFSPFRQNKNIPVLLPRNTSSGRGDDNGNGKRSGAALHRNIEGNITRHHGDHEHDAGCGENDSCAEDDEQNTHGVTRNDARGFRLRRPTGIRNDTRLLPRRNSNETNSQTETTDDHNRENQFKTGRNETKSGRILQEPIRRLRGAILSKDVNKNTVQPKKVREESVVDVTHDNAGYQQFTDGGSPIAKEIQKVHTGNETMTTIILSKDVNKNTVQPKEVREESVVDITQDNAGYQQFTDGGSPIAKEIRNVHTGNETMTTIILSKDVNKNTVQPKEIREESVIDVTHDNAGYQQFTDGGSPIAKEIQKVHTGNETMTTIILSKDVNKNTVQPKEVSEESVVDVTHDNVGYEQFADGGSPIAKEIRKVHTIHGLNFTTSQSNTPKNKSPVMMILDGYSIVKHKNGQNKFAEKSVRIHS